jgi:hypothetical protein
MFRRLEKQVGENNFWANSCALLLIGFIVAYYSLASLLLLTSILSEGEVFLTDLSRVIFMPS